MSYCIWLSLKCYYQQCLFHMLYLYADINNVFILYIILLVDLLISLF